MIGRAASSNPWIFRQIEQHVVSGSYEQPGEADRYAMIRSYYEMLLKQEDRNDAETSGKMKQFASYFTHGVRNGARLRADIYHSHTPGEIYDCVERFFEASLGQPDEAALAEAVVQVPAALP
jgi:tRNA-dihydrouridine synthase